MNLLTITAIDKHSSDTHSRTLSTNDLDKFAESIKEFEEDISFTWYELMTDELIDDYDNPENIEAVLDRFDVTY